MTTVEAPETAGRGERRPNRIFRAYWAAVGVSQLGSAVSLVTIPLIAAVTLRATPDQMAWLVAAGMLPSLLVRVPAAAWSDSARDRVPLMIACNVVQALIIGLVPLLWVLDALNFTTLVILVGGASLAVGVYSSLSSPVLVEIVPKEDLVDSNGRISATRSVADIGGPALGGVLLAVLAAPWVVLVDAVSFLLSALLLTRVPSRRSPTAEDTAPQRSPGGILALARALAGRSGVQAAVTVGLVNGVVDTVLVLFMVHELRLHSSAVGLLLGLGAVGGVAGGLLVGKILGQHGPGPTLAVGVLVTILSLVLLPFAVAGWSGATAVVVFELAGSFGGTLIIATVFGSLQGAAPEGKVARVMALAGAFLQVATLVGAAVGGVLGTRLGLRETVSVGVVLLVVALVPQVVRWGANRWKIDSQEIG
ncbi:MFS transporter [Sphaerisporangium perillae]|uniref:MFS transporter n=1 Tax=Sphaerisporangium perillae TaxID=2935860 RepID=UPI002435913A|nr:MFS transporter [Sphaerisporangium perillae]